MEVPVVQTTGGPAMQMTGGPEQQGGITAEQHIEGAPGHQAEQQSVVEEQEPPHQSNEANQAAAPGGSGRHRRFKKLNQKTKS